MSKLDTAIHLNPHHPGWYWATSVFNAYRKRDYRASADAALRINMPGYFWEPATSAAAFGQLGELEPAQKALKEFSPSVLISQRLLPRNSGSGLTTNSSNIMSKACTRRDWKL